MISVTEALDILSIHSHDFGIEEVRLEQSTGRILREEIRADRDMPPFDRVSMDGIAIRYEQFNKGQRKFIISGMAAAGSPRMTLEDPDHCIEIMTGSILPLEADTIIPYEWLSIENSEAAIIKDKIIAGQNIHRKGTDRKKGDLLIAPGRIISASEIGVLAAVGKANIQVSRLPRIMIISTGNELIEVDSEPQPHQVRRSNVYQIQAALLQMKINADRSHLQDDFDSIVIALETYIRSYDVIILSGGISEGKFDYVHTALESVGVKKQFYKISQRPGKPFLFGTHLNDTPFKKVCAIFAIPGNPVSSFLCFIRYIRPWLESCLQQESSVPIFAKLAEDVSFAPDLTYFMTVRLQQNELTETIAIPLKGHGSGDLSNLTDVDGFIELPKGRDLFRKGEVFSVFRF
jgi:molybdopterin molybdotransferase